MEVLLKCNDLKCRTQLHERAVVTTCSHIFCTQCADTSGLSSSTNAQRACPACATTLPNPDDVVVAGLNPSEDYKTSVLSGLNPTAIMECASRGLGFYSYQISQEIIYQEHLSRGLTDKYNTLSQQMDQLIADANSQIKILQEKLQAMHAEQVTLEAKNQELIDAYKEKSRAQQQSQKLYNVLKAQVMASQVADAAGNEAEFTLMNSGRGDSFRKFPGAKSGTSRFAHAGNQWAHLRGTSNSSGSSGQQHAGIGIGPSYASQLRDRELGTRLHSSQTASSGTPSQTHRSRLPVLGSARHNTFVNRNTEAAFVPSLNLRNPVSGDDVVAGLGNFGLRNKPLRR